MYVVHTYMCIYSGLQITSVHPYFTDKIVLNTDGKETRAVRCTDSKYVYGNSTLIVRNNRAQRSELSSWHNAPVYNHNKSIMIRVFRAKQVLRANASKCQILLVGALLTKAICKHHIFHSTFLKCRGKIKLLLFQHDGNSSVFVILNG